MAIICCTTEQVRGMGLFLGGRHRLICIVLSLCKHACKSVRDLLACLFAYLPAYLLTCSVVQQIMARFRNFYSL